MDNQHSEEALKDMVDITSSNDEQGAPGLPVIAIQNLSYSYPDTKYQTLSDINLTIENGDFVLLVGPSGSGKSTLLQILNGIIPKIKGGDLSGQVLINGLDISQHEITEISEHIGMVFQDAESQLTSVFVRDELAFGPENMCLEKDEILRRVDKAMRYVGLQLSMDKYVYEMSGGQQQRLAIGSVVAMDSKIMALDDPTANLDPVGTAEVFEVVKSLREEGRTVILATHWLDEFIHLATKLVVLNEGKLVVAGRPRDVFRTHGEMLANELGIWLPQLVEVDLAVRSVIPGLSDAVPLTIDEALEKYKRIRFDQDRFYSFKTRLNNDSSAVLEAKDVTFQYPDGTPALKGMSFKVPDGMLTGILGPNGAGKSTLASLIVGLKKISGGSLLLKEQHLKDLDVTAVARRVGFVFQNPEHQFVRDTVREEIAYSLEVIGRPKEEIEQKVKDMLKILKLEHLENRHPFGLSGGEKRRLSVAVMLVSSPELLILDEPTYGQDRSHVDNIMKLVHEQLNRGVTVMIITHDMRLIEKYVDYVLVLSKGKLLYEGRPEDMFDHLGVERDVTLRATPLQRLIRKMREGGKTIHHDTRTLDQFIAQIVC